MRGQGRPSVPQTYPTGLRSNVPCFGYNSLWQAIGLQLVGPAVST